MGTVQKVTYHTMIGVALSAESILQCAKSAGLTCLDYIGYTAKGNGQWRITVALRFPNIRSVAGMLNTGLVGFGTWLSSRQETESDIKQALQFRYPNASEQEINRGYARIAVAQSEGSVFKLSGEHPTESSLPIDSSFASKGRYEYAVDIDAYGETASGGRGGIISERYHRFYSDVPLTISQLEEVIEDFILEQIEKYPDSVPIDEEGEPQELFDFNYTVLGISRSS